MSRTCNTYRRGWKFLYFSCKTCRDETFRKIRHGGALLKWILNK